MTHPSVLCGSTKNITSFTSLIEDGRISRCQAPKPSVLEEGS